jgi:DNA polymerase III subunit delta'
MDIPWLQPLAQFWQSSQSQQRAPHALMIAGAAGTGKRAAAAWLVRQRLGMELASGLPQFPLQIPQHPDLRWLSTPQDKHSIGVDQIRELIGELSLTSYKGGGKVAVIEPADVMTVNAANSLLKTLEEPPGDTLLILVADRSGRLPATINSRCQRLSVRTPCESDGLEWLQRVQPGTVWPRVLRDSGFAPLAALAAKERLDVTNAMADDFVALAEGRVAPLPIAAKWAKHEPDFVLTWLGRQIQACISHDIRGDSTGNCAVVGDSVLGRIDRRNMFCYLDIINRLRAQPAGSFSVQLTLECLLIDWAGNLVSVMGTE